MTLEEFNNAPEAQARDILSSCCGSTGWTELMIARRPFADVSALHDAAQSTWFSLGERDWLEAFATHPKIGERTSGKWSAEEQAGMLRSNPTTADLVRDLNAQYHSKFGWIFIVCATGKSAEEMRALLETRLNNRPPAELQIAAAEQAKIMHLRLDKLLFK